MIELGVNVDHVATLRQARRTFEPDPITAAALAEQGGADGITFHLREDRRHIQDRDVELFMRTVTVRTNFELACEPDVLAIACRVRPHWALLVPEQRQEVTTEGGLDLTGAGARVATAVAQLREAGIAVSVFLDPDPPQLDAALQLGVDAVELHTGPYALTRPGTAAHAQQLERLVAAAERIHAGGVRVHAGHGLTYSNVRPIAAIDSIVELNIGHSIVSRSIYVGMRDAVAEMRRILDVVRP